MFGPVPTAKDKMNKTPLIIEIKKDRIKSAKMEELLRSCRSTRRVNGTKEDGNGIKYCFGEKEEKKIRKM